MTREGDVVESDGPVRAGPATDREGVATRADPMVGVYRHDVHKLRARPHAAATEEYAGVPVNEQVPLGANRDAALLSRPRGEPERTVANHESPYRLSLLMGEAAVGSDRGQAGAGGRFRDLVGVEDAERLHARWLTSDVAATFNESVYYPYTSLQRHVLLTAALLDAYRAGDAFADLWLVATGPGSGVDASGAMDVEAALAADVVEPHRTVLWTPVLALHVTATPGDRPAARLGGAPARSFADTWSRLSAHPLDVDGQRCWRLLDAQLRRIRSWSVALAYIDEFIELHGTAAGQGDWA